MRLFLEKSIGMEKIDLSSKEIQLKIQRIEQIFVNNYTSNQLLNIISTVKLLLISNFDLYFVQNKSAFVVLTDLKSNRASKALMSTYLSYLLLNKTILNDFFNALPQDVQEILKHLAFVRVESLRNLELRLGLKTKIKVEHDSWYSNYKIPNIYYLFKPQNTYRGADLILSLDPEVAALFQEFFPKPNDYYLTSVKEIPETCLVFNDNNEIFTIIESLLSYFSIESNQADISKKISNAQAAKVAKIFNIPEFFPNDDKKLNSIRSSFLIRFVLSNLKQQKNLSLPRPQLIKEWVQNMKNGNFEFVQAVFLFANSIGRASEASNDGSFFSAYLNQFQSLSVNEWFKYENLYAYFNYRSMVYVPVNYGVDKIYYTVKVESDYYDTDKVYIDSSNYNDAIIHQSIKGLIFLFSALGIFEIAYKSVDTELVGSKCFSPFDELAYFKLTDFGAYCLDLTKVFKQQIVEKPNVYQLDKDNLFIRLLDAAEPNDEIILKEVGLKISNNRYKVTPESFMKSCDSKQKINDKINFFEIFVDENPPQVWKDFFKTIKSNINPLKKIDDMFVFKIEESNKALINIIATNPKVRSLVTIAEGYKILLNKKDLPVFKAKLKELGYFLE